MALSQYEIALVVAGVVLLGVVVLSRVVADRPISLPILYVAFGAALFGLPLGFPAPNPLEHGEAAERLTEFGVIVALMGAGLKLDRHPGWPEWASTVRLLAVTMPLTIAAAMALGWSVLGLTVPTAMLLGAVLAPTDPVLASEVEVEEPTEGEEDEPTPHVEGMGDEVRFALTSEAGLNDGLAFPFTYLAILFALVGLAPVDWAGEWALVYVGYKGVVGVAGGAALGWLLARLVFRFGAETPLARSLAGLEALAGTLLVYGAVEFVGGYGFLAVFVAAVSLRDYEREHEYNDALHDVAELVEYLLMVTIMVLLGGALATGLLEPLTAEAALVGLAVVLVVRPLAGLVGLLGFDRSAGERGAIAFFGIRGIGSFYYLAYALNSAPFPQADLVWALVGFVVLVSVVLHGVTATPVMNRLQGTQQG
ncbi:cation:proton antiporter [Halomarina ordinaria]|uniref:Cation:proton antiporter n=1 Tax=Halomarina ordinaria TaxID=3033939 RepID=A0ABD5U8B4_9EURY|nr:cation:proton antiporter [Halomarina sp. PSRA2]